MDRLLATTSSILSRRIFLAGLGSTVMLVGACNAKPDASLYDPTATEIAKIVNSKRALIADAVDLMARDPSLSNSLQVVIDQNLIHIEALTPYSPSDSSPAAIAPSAKGVGLPGLATRCAVFSNNNLSLASGLSDAELSRLLALVAGSEMQHHALLTGLIL